VAADLLALAALGVGAAGLDSAAWARLPTGGLLAADAALLAAVVPGGAALQALGLPRLLGVALPAAAALAPGAPTAAPTAPACWAAWPGRS
jgi:hypothetical protein